MAMSAAGVPRPAADVPRRPHEHEQLMAHEVRVRIDRDVDLDQLASRTGTACSRRSSSDGETRKYFRPPASYANAKSPMSVAGISRTSSAEAIGVPRFQSFTWPRRIPMSSCCRDRSPCRRASSVRRSSRRWFLPRSLKPLVYPLLRLDVEFAHLSGVRPAARQVHEAEPVFRLETVRAAERPRRVFFLREGVDVEHRLPGRLAGQIVALRRPSPQPALMIRVLPEVVDPDRS